MQLYCTFLSLQDAMTALNSELRVSQGTIGQLKSSIKEVYDIMNVLLRWNVFFNNK